MTEKYLESLFQCAEKVISSRTCVFYFGCRTVRGKEWNLMNFVFPYKSFPQVLNKSQSSQLKGLEALHNAEASEVMKRLEQESKVGIAFLFLFGFDFCILVLFWQILI